jgi:CheY-like chemotaxis protein
VALTAFTRNEDRTAALLAGFTAHLGKPVEASELVSVLASITHRQGAPRRGA